MFLFLLTIALIGLFGYYLVILHRYQQFTRNGVPGPTPSFPFGNCRDSILRKRSNVYEVEDVYREFKDKAPISGFFSMFQPFLLATDPELIRRMFITDFNKFRNNSFVVDHIKDPIIARNPFWMKDEAWKDKRKEVLPAMSTIKLKAVYPLILDGAKSLNEYIQREITKDSARAFDSRDICARYTCDTITSTTFGAEAQSFTSDNPFFYKKGREMIRGIAEAQLSFLPTKTLPGAVEQFFIDIAKAAIKSRTENNTQQDDFLTYTIAMKEKKQMSDIDAAAHCVTLFLDGYETTSVTLHHAYYELGHNKKAQDKLRAEIMAVNGGKEPLDYDKLLELPYLNQVFYETLRLHPPLVMTTRVASEDVVIEGFKGHKITIKKDIPIWIPIPTIQRDPDYFPNPDEFIPERFNPEFGGVKSFKDRFVLIPWGDGPRICSGMRFAYVQVKSAIAEVIRKFEISIDPQMPKRENLKISPTEFLNVTDHKLMLNFKSI